MSKTSIPMMKKAVNLVRGAILLAAFGLAFSATPASAFGVFTSTSPSSGGTAYAAAATATNGQQVTVWVSNNPDWQFSHWTVFGCSLVGASNASPNSVIVSGDAIIIANFISTAPTYSLTLVAGVGGTTSPTGTVTGLPKDWFSILATPSAGYTFDGWTGAAGVENAAAASTRIYMDANKTVTANFKPLLRYTGYDPAGPGTASVTTNLTLGQLFTASATVPTVVVAADHRRQCVGWTQGAGDIPASGAYSYYGPFTVSTASSNRWVWTNEYLVVVNASTGADVVDYLGSNWWVQGTTWSLQAKPLPGYLFTGWRVGSSNVSGTLNLTVTGPVNITANFSAIGGDSDGDALPDSWEQRFNLDPLNGSGNDGPDGDPDRDGLSNYEEFTIQATNRNWYANPLSADTDGDGMDDFYERYYIDPTNLTVEAARTFISSVLDSGAVSINNGPEGNPDTDYQWSTTTGYRLTNRKLRNIDEWRGPDAIDPCTYSTINLGDPLYPFSTSRGAVKIKVANPADTDDQSRSNSRDSEEDGMDDGYEFTWDQWQRANGGTNEVFIYGVTNAVELTITNTVPLWDGATNTTRRYNPKRIHVDLDGTDPSPDRDVLYDYLTGGVSAYWYSDIMEYNASSSNAFSSGIVGAPHSIRRDQTPTPDDPPRCSHPFLIDFDQDGLPDGYEVIFGYDPWTPVTSGSVPSDEKDNRDDDWMAKMSADDLDTLRNAEVYEAEDFDPRTAWAATYPGPGDIPGPGAAASPNTAPYSAREEMWGPDGVMMLAPKGTTVELDNASHPLKPDTDGDGIWDGWEGYMGLNPADPVDGSLDEDGDGLSNWQEFESLVTSSTNRLALTPVTNWLNKIFPTDVNNGNTDDDDLSDSGERGAFNGGLATSVTNLVNIPVHDGSNLVYVATQMVFTAFTWNGACYTAGGLNPTSWDTDGDTLPDPWEAAFGGGANGTLGDTFADTDNDKLPNYLEYMTAATYHWQYDAWTPGLPSYNTRDFFQRLAKEWDWRATDCGEAARYIPLLTPGGAIPYSSTDPGNPDSDMDGMDDYWEIYHGLCPVYGFYSLPASRVYEAPMVIIPDFFRDAPWLVGDPRTEPWAIGTPESDPDGDGLHNGGEAVDFMNADYSPTYHTDPSPLWMSDPYYANSFVNLYYTPGTYWPNAWAPYPDPRDGRPTWMYDFEMNEGFDTDNDNVGDYPELNQTFTDALTMESPIKRRALYLPAGRDAYVRTDTPYHFLVDTFRSFTVEAWVKPLNPGSGERQIIVERPISVPAGNPLGGDPLRINFRLALDPAGVPYVEYTGEGDPVIFYQAKAASMTPVSSTSWTHLAGTYSVPIPGEQRGRLTLYVNGKMAQSITPNELPAVGRFGNEGYVRLSAAPFVIGAGDNVPGGTVIPRLFIPPPSPHSFFKGWIDEVRIWDGSRSQTDVVSGMKRRMKQADVLAFANTTSRIYGLYTFDDLPDPDHSPVSPEGYDIVHLNNRPADYVAAWFWAGSPEVSMRYTDYTYVPWVENTAAHIPERPAVDLGDPRRETEMIYANSGNPYNFRYFTQPDIMEEINPLSGGFIYSQPTAASYPLFTDCLPLRWAEADEDVAMWDGGGVPAETAFDSDADGLPDQWEETFGLNPLDSSGANGAFGDLDGDGLTNFVEFRCGLNPSSGDSDGDGIPDKNEDSDGDRLINLQELTRETLPDDKDTDDDGLTDWEEVTGFTDPSYVRPATSPLPTQATDPLNPLEPAVPRSVYLNGNARVIVPPSNKLMSESWTLEMWVKPDTNSNGGVLVSRFVNGLMPGQSGINYEMGLSTNAPAGQLRPYIRYSTTTNNVESEVRLSGAEATAQLDPAITVTIPKDEWTHLAGTYDSMSNSLALYINGTLATWRNDAIDLPPTVFGYAVDHDQDEVTIGASRSVGAVTNGYMGYVDEVRIWSLTRSAAEIAGRYNAPEAQMSTASGLIPLKNRTVTALGGVSSEILALPAGQPIHALVQFDSKATAAARDQLESAGIKVLNHVSDYARMVTATREQLVALGSAVRWTGLLKAGDKISARLNVDGSHLARKVLVQFHNDVTQAAALQAVQEAGGTVYQDKFLVATYLVATVSDAQAAALAANDGVAWMLPAADYLTSGGPVRLRSAHTSGGLEPAPFSVEGEGWDGPGRGSCELTYFFLNETAKLPPAAARQCVEDQLRKWEEAAAITFSEATQAGLPKSLDIGWFTGAHGDDADFDGAGGTLAHGYLPNDVTSEPIAGDLHFDDDEPWQIGLSGPGVDLESTALHEIGHNLGLGHSDDPKAIMYPIYDPTVPPILTADDIAGIQRLYALPVTGPLSGVSLFRFDDGGLTAQDFSMVGDWLTGWSFAARLDGAVFSTSETPLLTKDSDGDGMPDWWEMSYGLDPYSSTGISGANGDVDGDGLVNLYEYWCNTDPRLRDSNGNGVTDANEDSDGDELSNLGEVAVHGTNPGDPDTDDDGVADGAELDPLVVKADGRTLTSPVDSRSPLVQRAMVLTGAAYPVPGIVDGASDRLDLNAGTTNGAWTLEAWVNLATDGQTGSVIERKMPMGRTGYALRVVGNSPVVEFTTETGRRYWAGANMVLPSNTWVHLAGVWNAGNKTLRLFVDGVAYQAQQCLEIPATGAGDVVMGEGLTGYLDEVRIWDAARTADEILSNMRLFGGEFVQGTLNENSASYKGVFFPDGELAFADAVFAYSGGTNATENLYDDPEKALGIPDSDGLNGNWVSLGRSDLVVSSTGVTFSTGFVCLQFTNTLLHGSGDIRPDLYVFQDLVEGERSFVAISRDGNLWVPVGYADSSVSGIDIDPYIESTEDSYRFVLVLDAGDNPEAAYGGFGRPGPDLDAVGLVSYLKAPLAWYPFDDGENTTVTNLLTGGVTGHGAEDFANPLNWDYALAGITFATNVPVDLIGEADADADGLPNWWEALNFDGDASATNDLDEDGLNNLYEFYCDTNPHDNDSDNNGDWDGVEDCDGDGLENQDEQWHLSDPWLADTDDDGIGDLAEKVSGTNPSSSQSPQYQRGIILPGTAGSYVEMPLYSRFALKEWTLEAWICPTASQAANLIYREAQPGDPNFFLGLNSSMNPVAGFGTNVLTASTVVASGGAMTTVSNWTHVAATYQVNGQYLRLYVNGAEVTNMICPRNPNVGGVGPVVQRIGEGFAGAMDEVRIWNVARGSNDLMETLSEPLTGAEPGLVAYYRFDDGTSYRAGVVGTSRNQAWDHGQVEDFTAGYERNWEQDWRDAATIVGAVTWTNLPYSVPVLIALDSDGDGLPDWWESQYLGCGLDPLSAAGDAGAYGDPDADGIINLDEYRQRSNPCVADILTVNPLTLDVQVGHSTTATVAFIMRTGMTNATVNVFSSDETLFTVEPATLTFDAATTSAVVTITGVALGEGLGANDGVLMMVGSAGGASVPVTVYNGVSLTLGMTLAQDGNVVAGDTATMSIGRQRSVGSILQPQEITLSVANSNLLSVPATVTIPAGTDMIWFPVTGVAVASNVMVKAEAPGYPHADYPVSVSAPSISVIQDGVPTNIVVVPTGAVTRIQIARGSNQEAAPLRLSIQSFDSDVVSFATNYVEFAARDSVEWIDLVSGGVPGTVLMRISSGIWYEDYVVTVIGSVGVDNGPYADPDGDGLCNLYEGFAGTNPNDWDTDDDGFGDYDSRQGPGYRTYGELYDDGDGIPDSWEIQYEGPCQETGIRGLDPAYYDAQLDPDRDGWSNYAEYMNGTDPLKSASHPVPVVALHFRYSGILGPDIDRALTGTGTADEGTGDGEGGTGDPAAGDTTNEVTAAKAIVLNFYTTPNMDGHPDATMQVSSGSTNLTVFDVGWVREGNNYVFAYLDDDGDGEWNPDREPAGIGQFQPINMGWGAINNVEIGLTDKMPGYSRFAWEADPTVLLHNVTNAITGGIQRNVLGPRNYWHEGDWLSLGRFGSPTGTLVFLISTNVSLADYKTNVVVMAPAVTLATPTVHTPHDTVFVYARNELEFIRDTNATAYRLQIATATNLAPIITVSNIVPYMDSLNISKAALPVYAGDNYVPTNGNYASSTWTNGRYWVRVQALTPNTQSAYSPWSAINFNLQEPAAGGKSMISGDVYYFGKVSRGYGAGQTSNLTVIVQAFESPGFSGVADAQVQISYACDTNAPSANKGSYSLKGLATKTYYVRAFIDCNGNRTLDGFEPMGFARIPATGTEYQPMMVALTSQSPSVETGVRIVIRDRDTDDDQLSDGWEWMYYGTLGRGAYDIGTNTLTLLRNYEIEPYDLDPTKPDYDGDGLEDVFEIIYSDGITYAQYQAGQSGNTDHYEPYPRSATSEGTDLNPTLWDTDGDGLSDGYEILNGLNPLDPDGDADGDGVSDAQEVLVTRTSAVAASDVLRVKQVAVVTPAEGFFSLTWTGKDGVNYQVQYSDDLKTWQDAPQGAFSGAAEHLYVEESPVVRVRYFRVVTK